MHKMKKHELVIIFCYHSDDSVTRRNLAVLKENNPGTPVVLISNGGDTMRGSLNSKKLLKNKWRPYAPYWPFLKLKNIGYLWHLYKKGPPKDYFWLNADLPLYLAYDKTRKKIPSKRYVFVEWDCYCNVNLRDFYKEVWQADLGGRHFFEQAKEPEWDNFIFNSRRSCPPVAKEHMVGVAPLAGILLSERALSLICQELKKNHAWVNTFCELRVGAIVSQNNLSLQSLPDHKKKYLRDKVPVWEMSEINERAVWHMVKE